MTRYAPAIFLLLLPPIVRADAIAYECTSFPDEPENGWVRDDVLFAADRWLNDGQFVQEAEIVDPGPPELPEEDHYRYLLQDFAGAPTFYVEWTLVTDGPQESIGSVAPASLVAYGNSGIAYHFTIAEDLVRFIPIFPEPDPPVWIGIEPKTPHKYRIEIRGSESYAWYIDDELAATGIPGGPYPRSDSAIVFGARAGGETIQVRWSYIRFGEIPIDSSGDFDSSGDVSLDDFYFFDECLADGGPGSEAGPGCLWADMDGDGDVDFADFGAFQLAFTE